MEPLRKVSPWTGAGIVPQVDVSLELVMVMVGEAVGLEPTQNEAELTGASSQICSQGLNTATQLYKWCLPRVLGLHALSSFQSSLNLLSSQSVMTSAMARLCVLLGCVCEG